MLPIGVCLLGIKLVGVSDASCLTHHLVCVGAGAIGAEREAVFAHARRVARERLADEAIRACVGRQLMRVVFEGYQGATVSLSRTDFTGAALFDVDFRRANLYGAIFREAMLVRCDLRGTNLCNADLRGARLVACDVTGADLDGALT